MGDALTYKVLTKSNKIIYWSAIRSALDPAKRNQRLSPLGGDTASNYLGDKIFIRSSTCNEGGEARDGPSVQRQMVTIDPKDLIGRTFLRMRKMMDNDFALVLLEHLLRKKMT